MENISILLSIIFATTVISSTDIFSVNADSLPHDEITIRNDSDVSKWFLSSGTMSHIIVDGDDTKGIEFNSSSEHPEFQYVYENKFIFDDFNLDFTLLDSYFDYSKAHDLSFVVTSGLTEVLTFNFRFFNENDLKTYDVTFKAGEVTKTIKQMEFIEEGHIQFKIAYESFMDRETGNNINLWNLVLGIPKNMYTTSNDKYSIVMNRTNENNFTNLDAYFDAFRGKACALVIKGQTELGETLDFMITQICDYRFYNTVVLPKSYITVTKVTYTDISFIYNVPELGIDYKGFYIRRYWNGVIDEKILYTSKTAISKNDNYLKQNSIYEYQIYAVSNVSSTGRIACQRIPIEFETLEVQTQKGDIKYLLIGGFTLIGVTIASMLVYVFWFDVKGWFKRHAK